MKIRSRALLSMMVLAFAAAAIGQGDSRKVSFRAPAGTAKRLIPDLGKAIGTNLSTSPQTENEVLLIDFKDVAVEAVLGQIAKVAAAEWKAEGEGFRLVRSQAMQNQQEREFLDGRAARIKVEQDRIASELGKLQSLTPEAAKAAAEAQRKQLDEMTSALREGRQPPRLPFDSNTANLNPANRLAMRLLAGVPAADLARIGMGSRVVYSSVPTRVQRAMPGSAGRAIGDFTREYQVWMEAQAAPSADPSGLQVVGPWGNVNRMENGFGKALLVVSRVMFSGDLQAELLLADGAGNIFARQFRVLSMNSDSAIRQGIRGNVAAAPEPAPAPAANEKPIELSALAKEHAALMAQSPSRGGGDFIVAGSPLPAGGGAVRQTISVQAVNISGIPGGAAAGSAPRLPVSAEWQQRLSNPDKSDPLSFAVSELFAGLARAREKNIVASLPDSALIPLSARTSQIVTPTHLLEIAKNSLDLVVEESEGWMTVMPKFPAYVREARIDRDDLARLLTSIQKDGRLTLDTMSRYAQSRRNPAPPPGFDGRCVSALSPIAFGEFNMATFNWRMLQLYATLSADQRRNLGDGGTLSLGALSPSQFAIVDSMIFDDLVGPIQMQDPRQGPGPAEVRTSARMVTAGGAVMSFGGSGGKLADERTEFLPAGVPAQGVLTVRITNQDAVFASRKDGSAEPRLFSADSYGVYMGMAPNIVLTGANAPTIPQYDLFRPAAQQTLDFHFQLTPRAMLDKQLRDTWFQIGAREVSYEGLPDAFRQRAEEAAKRMKDSRANIEFGGPTRAVRPPAP